MMAQLKQGVRRVVAFVLTVLTVLPYLAYKKWRYYFHRLPCGHTQAQHDNKKKAAQGVAERATEVFMKWVQEHGEEFAEYSDTGTEKNPSVIPFMLVGTSKGGVKKIPYPYPPADADDAHDMADSVRAIMVEYRRGASIEELAVSHPELTRQYIEQVAAELGLTQDPT